MISIISAVAKNGVIGNKNKIPWHIPGDFKHFKDLTMGHPVLMGSTTFLSIVAMLGKPLPGRTNIVVSKETMGVPAGVYLYHSLDQALAEWRDKDLFVIGGGQIYRQTIGYADRLYITHVDQLPEGDSYFPEIRPTEWKATEEESHEGYRFVTYTRIVPLEHRLQ